MELLTKSEIYKLHNKLDDTTYVYSLHRPSGEIFYVGIGKHMRCVWHAQKSSDNLDGNRLKQNIINKEGRENILVQLIKYGTEQECLDLEKQLIFFFGRQLDGGVLANLSEGGEKGPTGCLQSEESNEKRRQTCLNQVEVHRTAAKKQWNDLTDDQKEERVKKMRSGKMTKEGQERMDKSRIERWNDPDIKQKHSDSLKSYYENNPDAKLARQEAAKAKWADPEFRERMMAARKAAREKKLALKEANKSILENTA